ncbi:MAG: hypothetical protein ACL7BU_15820 [Candidatus Phlomobacter fragariae]
MSPPNPLCFGIDISKASPDIATNSNIEQFNVGNNHVGLMQIIS